MGKWRWGHGTSQPPRSLVPQYRELSGSRCSSAASSVVDPEEAALEGRDFTEYLAEPEFSGLWEQEEEQQQVPLPSKALRAAKIKPP